MSMPRKGSRKIVVDGITYRWRVSRWKKLGEWRAAEPGEVDPEWLEAMARYGGIDVVDGECSIVVERAEGGSSLIRCICPAKKSDALLNRQQLVEFKPSLVRKIIKSALDSGWDPASRRDFLVALDESLGETPDHLPAPKARVRRIY